ncbi:hypothetical protein FRB94_012687 [Tulasnella sp. JGI-2019a]|nr:hypothetical protein FRB94_012687 [Tulasnella sp. JGI-2019a]
MDDNIIQKPGSAGSVQWLTFSGGGPENVLLFAQGVHRFAFAHGRQNDDVWMANYAYGCLSGDALSWFNDLDAEVKKDWSKLRPAMFAWFTQSSVAASPPSRCRLRVVKGNGKVIGYVAPPTAGHNVKVAASAQGALVLNIPRVWNTQNALAHIQMVRNTTTTISPFGHARQNSIGGKRFQGVHTSRHHVYNISLLL